MTDDDYRAFHAMHCRPVVNLYEQAWFLDACLSMEYMATLKGELALAKAFKERYEHIARVLETRHWDEETGFYYDWDVHGDCLVKVPNQDAFYLLKHLHTPERAARVMKHFDDPEEFGLCCTPTLARNAAGFRPNGYWSGGYWPRESNYIAAAFDAAGYREKALEVALKALCSDTGKLVRENMSPLTGKDNTGVTTLAYSALLNVVLHAICGSEWARTNTD